jgi:predicted double-glycine peptidase
MITRDLPDMSKMRQAEPGHGNQPRQMIGIKRAFAAATILLAGCAVAAVLTRAYYDRSQHKLARFPILTQSDAISCGPTACAMVLRYYGRSVSIEEVKRQSRTRWNFLGAEEVGMTAPHDIQAAIEHFGVPCSLKTSRLEELKRCVDERRPPIVLLRTGATLWHYVVVIGYTDEALVLANPAGREDHVGRDLFLASWAFSKDLAGNDAPPFDPCRHLVEIGTGMDGNIAIIPEDTKE